MASSCASDGFLDNEPDHDNRSKLTCPVMQFDNSFDLNSSSEGGETDEVFDIKVRVPSYNKIVTNFETYLVFNIFSEGKREEFKSGENSVDRRYTEFEWLFNRLEESNSMVFLPPLPEKHQVTHLERFTGIFIDQRRAALERFLKRVVQHPILTKSEDLFTFLTVDKPQFDQYRSRNPASVGRLTRLVEDVQVAAHGSPIVTENNFDTTGSSDSLDQRFLEVSQFSDTMGRMSRVTDRVATETESWSSDLTSLGEALLQWAASESPGTAETLVTVARACEIAESASLAAAQSGREELSPGFHEYNLYANNVKAALRRRKRLQADLAKVQMEQNRCEREIESGADLPPTSTTSSIMAMFKSKETPEQKRDKLVGLKNRANTLHDRVEQATHDIEAEMVRWRTIQRRDVTELLRKMVQSQMDLFSACDEGWRAAFESLEQSSTSNNS